MATRFWNSRRRPSGKFQPFPSIRCTTLVLLVILGSVLGSASGSRCKVESCSRDLDTTPFTTPGRRTASNNHRYCTQLRTHTDCLRATARTCRGDLNYHAMTRLVQRWMTSFNCTHLLAAKQEDTANSGASPESSAPDPTRLANQGPSVCTYHGPWEPNYCSLFGDPHLVTFRGQFQTCKVAGAWPLIDNPHLAVSVTNEPVIPGSSVTATTKVTVIIKSSPGCTPEKTYEASVDSVPASFVDGSQWAGASANQGPVRIIEKEAGRHVEILARHLGATLVVRQVGKYLTFSAKLPRGIVEQGAGREGLQLCLRGCPAPERMHASLPSSGRLHHQALEWCQGRNLTGFFLDSCVFDVLATSDASFAEAALFAQRDYVEVFPQNDLNRTRQNISPGAYETLRVTSGAVPEAHGPGRPLLMLLFVSLMSLNLVLLR